jgi:ATP-dependent Clp protease ATP-binding subunit ClpA
MQHLFQCFYDIHLMLLHQCIVTHHDEPSVEDTVAILKGLRDRYEAHHRINISDEALEAAAKLVGNDQIHNGYLI